MNKSGLFILIILYAAFISLGLPDQAFGVAWPDMRRFFGQPLDAGGVIIFLLAMMSAFTSFGAGWLRKRLSIAAVLIVSTFLTVVGMLGFALSPVWLVLLVAVLPYGLGAGAIDACLNDYVAKNYSSRQMNWLHACWGIGASLGPAIMTVAVTRFNWQKGYVFIAVLQMILLLFLFSLEKCGKKPRCRQRLLSILLFPTNFGCRRRCCRQPSSLFIRRRSLASAFGFIPLWLKNIGFLPHWPVQLS